jgi:hypothetical protein
MKLHGPTKVYNYTPSLTQQIAMSNEFSNTMTTTRVHGDPEILPYSQQKLHPESFSQKSHSDSGTSEIGAHSDDANINQYRGAAKGKIF